MVPGSTLMYGSNFISVTLKPRASRIAPTEEAATPFPREDTTPPVMKMNLVAILGLSSRSLKFQSGRPVFLACTCRQQPLRPGEILVRVDTRGAPLDREHPNPHPALERP